jgi:hypothetical protein
MNKSYEALREEHRVTAIELGKLQQKVQTLSTSILKRGFHMTYSRAHELLNRPVFFEGRVWYMDKVIKRSGHVSATGWIVDRNIIQRHTVNLMFPDQSYLGGVPFYDDGTVKRMIETISTTAKDIVNHYEKKAEKEIKRKENSKEEEK